MEPLGKILFVSSLRETPRPGPPGSRDDVRNGAPRRLFFLAFLNKHGLSTDYYEGRRPGAAAFVKGLLRALVYAVTLRIAKASEEDVHFRVEALRVVNEHVVSILLSLRSLVPDVTRDIMDAVTHATFLKRAAEGAEPDASLDNWIRIRSYDARNVNILHILSGIGGIAFTS